MPLNPHDIEFSVAIILSLLCGLVIGGEREIKGKPAGVRTHMLVVTASMIFTFLSRDWPGSDPTRIAAQIVSGVGFLGAGIILKSNDRKIVNVTTAASIWYAAAIGMAIGFKMYFIGFTASLAAAAITGIPFKKVTFKKIKTRKTLKITPEAE